MGPATRASLVRWMGWVARLFGPVPGTLHRAVSYFDRFLSLRPLADSGVDDQLRLLVAAKYEDQGAVKEHANATDRRGVRHGAGRAGRGARAARRVRLPARRAHGVHVRGAVHGALRRQPEGAGGPARGALDRGAVPARLRLPEAAAVGGGDLPGDADAAAVVRAGEEVEQGAQGGDGVQAQAPGVRRRGNVRPDTQHSAWPWRPLRCRHLPCVLRGSLAS
jgi:hypothetical protein